MTESEIQTAIRIELGTLEDVRLFRNNVGVAYYGRRYVWDSAGTLTIYQPVRVAYGLTPGSSDLIGLRSFVITPDMVGKRVAIFAAVEVKTPKGKKRGGQPSGDRTQAAFLSMVNDAGGLAGVATSVEEAKDILEME